jgi:cytochrome c biogenesis protein CcmG, thiol:disulfide interchange protein DsbE
MISDTKPPPPVIDRPPHSGGELYGSDREVMRRRDFLRMTAVAGLACLLPRCQSGLLPVGATPGETHLVDLAGNKVSLPTDYKGKVLVIHFWVTCPVCVAEILTFESIHRNYSGQDVVFCSVNVGGSKGAAERYLSSLKVAHTILLDEESVSIKHYGISGVPTTYVLDRKNIVKFRTFGPVGKAKLEKTIQDLL